MFDVIIIPGSGSLIFKSSSNNGEIQYSSSIKLNEQAILEFLNKIIFNDDLILKKIDISNDNNDNLLVLGNIDEKIKYINRNQFTASYAISASYANYISPNLYYDNLITNEIILRPDQEYNVEPIQQIFTASNYFISNSLEVFFNGIKLLNGYDYNVINLELKQFQITSSIQIKTGDSIIINYKKLI